VDLRSSLPDRALEAAALTARYLAALWDTPSYDAWEENPDRVHTSTLGAILAGFRGAHRLGVADSQVLAAAAAVERRLRELGREYGWLPKWSGNPAVDGSLLWLGPLYGLFDADDPLWTSTLDRIESELVAPDGGVHRYRADTYYGGGEWLLLAASLGFAHLGRANPGDRQLAEAGQRWVEAQADQAGNMPEQVACHALAPDRIAEWDAIWGPSAKPLIWSHAWYLRLVAALEAAS
jgi:GH15 family glucan-1,4-alpha-glucosidase